MFLHTSSAGFSYNLHIDHPTNDLLMLPDDILLHSTSIPITCIWCQYLDWYLNATSVCQQAQSLAVQVHQVTTCLTSWGLLLWRCPGTSVRCHHTFSSPIITEIHAYVPAVLDAYNPGATTLTSHGVIALYPMFVNNTGNMNTCTITQNHSICVISLSGHWFSCSGKKI